MSPPRRSADEMFPLIERYLSSGNTQAAFCAEQGLSLPVFTYWLAKYRRQRTTSDTAFVEITPTATEHPFLEVVYPSGIRLRLFAPVEAAFLTRLVGGL